MLYLIDVVGTCNLRCPSCPVGNMSSSFIDTPRPKGFMDLEKFKKIIQKICAEDKSDFRIALYNWGEALLHPQIYEITEHLAQKRISFDISTNLNTESDLGRILKTSPALLRVSISGATQETYQKSHVGGDINLVISNLYRLRYLQDRARKLNIDINTHIQVYYHLYKDNCGDDLVKIHNICSELGFELALGIAYFMPLEKVIYGLVPGENFSEQDKATLERMYLSLETERTVGKLGKSPRCILKDQQTVINHDGSVPVCCSVFDPIFFIADDFLDLDLASIQELKEQSPICAPCMENGLHDAIIQNPLYIWNALLMEQQEKIPTKYITNLSPPPAIFPNPNYPGGARS